METVEFLLCYEDRTWDTFLYGSKENAGFLNIKNALDQELIDWFNNTYIDANKFPGVVYVGIYKR